jgi:nucleoside-diphosphate-sugar epimerase
VVVRPGMVYGPRAQSWILNLCRYVKKGVPVIFGSGSGLACPVYVDNLIDGMLLAAVSPHARNETYNFCDDPMSPGATISAIWARFAAGDRAPYLTGLPGR